MEKAYRVRLQVIYNKGDVLSKKRKHLSKREGNKNPVKKILYVQVKRGKFI